MRIGYARVSTIDQNLDLQLDSLKAAGCERIITDKISGVAKERPQLEQLLENVREGDVLIVWKLDRLGRSLRHLVEIVDRLQLKGAGLLSLNDPIDTTSASGRLIFGVFAALAEFERELIQERTRAGLNAARARGRTGGKPKGLSIKAQNTAIAAESLYNARNLSVNQIAKQLNISKSTLYQYLRHRGVTIGKQGAS
jgi:DNA invertase Pin-like site-specific DNA recombinase